MVLQNDRQDLDLTPLVFFRGQYKKGYLRCSFHSRTTSRVVDNLNAENKSNKMTYILTIQSRFNNLVTLI